MQYSVRSATDLGAAIQDARREAGLTQLELAERAGVSRPYLAHVERGRSSRLLELLLDLLRVLDLELVVRPRSSRGA
ncbi:MAG: helix-turn-helix transcriptional regulator [Nitriliruptor sp.]|uniref:helix-turn-helix domain-containing protein n=1 Tax=Nitriliruptor sp. TaxID=2448056 RepID=UPI0034A089F9